MKFKKSFLRALFRYCSVIIVILLIVIIILRVGRKHPSTGYFSSRCIDYKQREYSRRLNDRIVDYSAAAKLRGVKICKDDNDLKNRISEGLLVKVRSGSGYTVEKMTYSYPYVTRDSKELLDEIAVRLREKAAQKGLRGVKFYITSMTRRTDNVRKLRRFNGNASANSPHLYGNAFDISYKRFIARKWRLTNCDIRFLKEALAEVIWQLKSENKCWATYEKVQNCFHVVAR
jgi:hypothetical protein